MLWLGKFYYLGEVCFLSLVDTYMLTGLKLTSETRAAVYKKFGDMLPFSRVGFQKFYYNSETRFGFHTFSDQEDLVPYSGEIVVKVLLDGDALYVPFAFGNPLNMLMSSFLIRYLGS